MFTHVFNGHGHSVLRARPQDGTRQLSPQKYARNVLSAIAYRKFAKAAPEQP